MKNYISLIFLLIISFNINAQVQQVPQGFNYQATVRNLSGDLVMNQNVYFKFNILQGSQTAIPSYVEEHFVPTDDLGQVSLVIGQGSSTIGDFSELNWSLGSYYLGIEIDTNTGTGYVAMGTTQFFSVPYALYAENAGNTNLGTPTLNSVLQQGNSANSQQIKDILDPTDLQDAVTNSYLLNLISDQQSQIDALATELNNTIDDDGDGFSENQGDCDDSDAFTHPGAANNESATTCMTDADGDGYGDNTGTNPGTDCNDSNASIYPDALEIEDNIDNDCNGEIDEGFVDSDGDGFSENQGDCDDSDAFTYPGAADNDSATACMTDADGDGYGDNIGTNPGTDCNDSDSSIYPGAAEIEDGIDNDCDNEIDEVVDPNLPASFSKKAVVEDFTGTWCGYCPRVSYAASLVEEQTDKVFVVGVHNGDQMANSFGSALEDMYNITGFPTAYIDRADTWTYPEPNNVSQVLDAAEGTVDVGLAIESSLTGSTLEMTISTGFLENKTDVRLIVFVLEDGIIANQTNYTSYYGGASTITDFEHNGVLRYVATDIMGDTTTSTIGIHEQSFSVNLSSQGVQDSTKTGVLAMLVDNTSRILYNAQYAAANESKAFD